MNRMVAGGITALAIAAAFGLGVHGIPGLTHERARDHAELTAVADKWDATPATSTGLADEDTDTAPQLAVPRVLPSQPVVAATAAADTPERAPAPTAPRATSRALVQTPAPALPFYYAQDTPPPPVVVEPEYTAPPAEVVEPQVEPCALYDEALVVAEAPREWIRGLYGEPHRLRRQGAQQIEHRAEREHALRAEHRQLRPTGPIHRPRC